MFSDYLFFLKDMLAIDTVEGKPMPNAPFGEGNALCLEKTLQKASELGFSVKNGKGFYGYADFGEGELFGIAGHLDTVPIGDGWDFSPYGETSNGVLYGRGVLDDKGPILACLFAAAELIKEGYTPRRKLRIIFGCNEESGWKCMDAYERFEQMPVEGFSPDGDFPAINCEKGIVYYEVSCDMPSGVYSVNGGLRPNMVMDFCEARGDFDKQLLTEYGISLEGDKIVAYGKSAHGSTPQEGDNAFHRFLRFAADSFGGEWKGLYAALSAIDGSGLNIKLFDDKSGKLTCNTGVVKTVDGKLCFSLDIRYPVSFDKSFILEKISTSLNFLKGMKIKETMCHAPLYIAANDPLLVSLLSAYDEVMGGKSRPIAIGGGTYARALPKGAAFGPIFPDCKSSIHQRNESVALEDLRKLYDIYKLAIKKLIF